MLFKGNSSRLELLIGKIQAHKEPPSPPQDDKCHSKSKDALGTGSSSWHSEDGGPTLRRGGGETPSSCATPTSASFPSEPEVDGEVGINIENNHPVAPYPCQFCERTFPRLSYLKKHEQSHGDQMPYRCSWCARLFKHKRSRDRHVKLHTGDRRYRCAHCEAAFSRSDHLKIHMKTHDTQKPYQCTACSRGYNTAAALTSHMQSHKRTQSGLHGKLEMDFGRRSVSSMSTSSPPIPNSPSPSLNLSAKNNAAYKTGSRESNTPFLNSPLKLACMYCTRDSFTSMQQLQMHVNAMHQAILSGENLTGGESVTTTTNNRAEKLQDEREKPIKVEESSKQPEDNCLSCNQCTMKLSSSSSLRDHLLTIHRTDEFNSALVVCPLCGTPCSSAAAYAEHYVLQHCDNRRINSTSAYDYSKTNGFYDYSNKAAARRDGDRALKNDLINNPLAAPADLTGQKRSRQDNNYSSGPLLCGQCGAALSDFESFREHLAKHLQASQRTEEIRHSCPKCEVTFAEREDMLAHLTKHYMGQTTKEYTCGACNKFYPHPDLLQRHLLDSHAHHLYRCALCRDTFDSRVAIQVHFAVRHSQECCVYRCNSCTGSNNENSPGNVPGENRNCFRSEAEMASHVRTVHATPAALNENQPAPRSPASTPGLNSANPRCCAFCGVYCNTDLELQLHLATHSASLYRCPICHEAFAVEFLLDRHIAQVHHVSANHTGVNQRNAIRENGIHRSAKTHEDVARGQKRGRSPASSNNNSANHRDNNNKRANYGGSQQQCELCERGEFANEAELQAHKKLAHNTPCKSKSLTPLSMTCAYCGEVCRSRGELESHTRVQHASSEPGGRHKCNICDEVCPTGTTLAEHKLQKHCKIQLSDTCVVCRGALGSEAQFLEHVQRHSLESVEPQQRIDSTLPHLPAPCVICRQTLISDTECRLHAKYHLRASSGSHSSNSSPSPKPRTQSHSCCLCLREFNVDDLVNLPTNHSSGSGQTLHVCKICYNRHAQGLPILNSPYEHVGLLKLDRIDARQFDLATESNKSRKHENESSEDAGDERADTTNNRCNECGVKFETAEEVERHKSTEHKPKPTESNTYTCFQCQMVFPTEAKIQQHVRKEHLDSTGKNYFEALRCHLCLFEAHSPLQLQAHLIEHTFAGCAALSCYICQSLFTAPVGLQNHMLQEHGLKARPYDCSFCNLKFFFRAELDHHMVTCHGGRNGTSPPSEQRELAKSASNDNKQQDCLSVKKEESSLGEDEVNVDEHIVDEQKPNSELIEKETKVEIDEHEICNRED